MPQNRVQDHILTPLCFFFSYSLDILYRFYHIFIVDCCVCCSPYILGTHGSQTLLPRKDFQSFLLVPSLRSGRRQTVFHLSNLTVLKWRNRLRRVVILEKVLGKRGNDVFGIVNIFLIIDGMDWQKDRSLI